MSFHHVCGTTAADAEDCKFSLAFDHDESNPVYELPNDRKVNDGAVASVTEWLHEDVKLPLIDQGDRLKYLGEFDSVNGLVNLDNVVMHTRQR